MIRENLSLYKPINVVCYSYVYCDRQVPEPTDKVLFPSYVMQELMNQNPDFVTPIFFSVSNKKTRKRIICSVLSFDSPDQAYFPQWMLDHIGVNPGDTVSILKESVPPIKQAVFKPLHPAFYNLKDPLGTIRAVLTNYTTLTIKTKISFKTNVEIDGMNVATEIQIQISMLQPFTTVHLIDSTFDVEFEENPEIMPKYEQKIPKQISHHQFEEEDEEDDEEEGEGNGLVFDAKMSQEELKGSTDFVAFAGQGNRLGTTHDKLTQELDPNSVLCEFCNSPIKKQNYRLHKVRCQKMNKLCPICNMKLLVNSPEAENHMKLHEMVECMQCHKEIERQFLKEHYNSLCPKRLVQCKYCPLMKEADVIHQHQSYCGDTMGECEACGMSLKLRDMERHKDELCPYSEKYIKREQEKLLKQQQQSSSSSSQFNLGNLKMDLSGLGDLSQFGIGTSQQQQGFQPEFECPLCFVAAASEEDLQTHMLCYHPELYD